MSNSPRLLNEKEAAARVGLSRFAFQGLRKEGKAPTHLHIGKRVRYSPEALDEFIQRHTVRGEASA